jgi:hypothetical protein
MTSIGSQGSLERTPGALFRAMGTLFLGEQDCTRESLARELRGRLDIPRFDYHVRTTCRSAARTKRNLRYANHRS